MKSYFLINCFLFMALMQAVSIQASGHSLDNMAKQQEGWNLISTVAITTIIASGVSMLFITKDISPLPFMIVGGVELFICYKALEKLGNSLKKISTEEIKEYLKNKSNTYDWRALLEEELCSRGLKKYEKRRNNLKRILNV